MAKTREQKKEIIDTIEGNLKRAASAVFVHFKGVSVADESRIRRSFREEGLGYMVAKKTLVRRALDNLGHKHEDLALEGELALAYNTTAGGDPTLAANRVHGFGKEIGADKLVIVGGLFEGKLVDAAAMQEIATIPAMPVLRGKLANLLNSPLQRLVMVMDQRAQKMS